MRSTRPLSQRFLPADNADPESILDLIDEITGDEAVDPAMLGTDPNVRHARHPAAA